MDGSVEVIVRVNYPCEPGGGRIFFGVGPVREQPDSKPTAVGRRPGPAGTCRGDADVQITLTDTQTAKVRIKAMKDKKGNVVTATSPPNWLTDNTDLLILTPAADGMSCDVAAQGPLGTGTLSAHVPAAGGDIVGLAEVVVTTSAPVTVELEADAPTEQP